MKKKNLFLMAAMMLASLGCSSQDANSYVIKGLVKGLPDGAMVKLFPVSHSKRAYIDSAMVNNGEFVLKGSMPEPRAVYLCVKDAFGLRRLMLANGTIQINGFVTSSKTERGTSYNLETLTVEGSPLTDKYDSLMQVRKHCDSLFSAYHARHEAFSRELSEARRSKDKLRIDSLMHTDAYKALAADERAAFDSIEAAYNRVFIENKETFWGPLMIMSLTSYLTEKEKPWYDLLSPAVKDSYYGRMVKEEVAPEGLLGKAVPTFTLKDSNGKERSLKELCQGKKYILIDFWASWCNPCRKEIPNIKKQYEQYAAKGFEVVSISIDKKRADWEKALKEEKLPWPNFLDEAGLADKYKVRFVPTLYLINAQGRVVAENPRGQVLANKLAELFK